MPDASSAICGAKPANGAPPRSTTSAPSRAVASPTNAISSRRISVATFANEAGGSSGHRTPVNRAAKPVWRTQSDDFWVTYKVFGAMGLTFAFILTQTPLIGRHMIAEEGDEADKS